MSLELMEPAMMVAMAQSRQQCKRFMANSATYSSMQVGSSLCAVACPLEDFNTSMS